ncbi:MAG TPA: CLC_0170 family protein [Bacillus sp. (in: firmicutes)]|nr:CLC_0170 family protein [Bacillus sp. (in: firmicutes)]
MNNIGFIGYAVTIFIATGCLLLFTDVKAYKNEGFKKERKAALILGWTNLSLGLLLLLTNWIYKTWVW